MFVQGSHTFAMFYAHVSVKNGEYLYCMRILRSPNLLKQHCREYICIVALLCT